jgi:hypothetical protein
MHSDRLSARRRRPTFDSMEERQLLTTFLMLDNPRATEGTGGTSAMTFTVKLVTPSASTVQVDYDTANRTASAGSDYVATSGTLTFAPGEVAKTVRVPIVTDSVDELNETFTLNLSNPVNASIFAAVGTGMIIDDDAVAAPAVSVADVQMRRGLTGARSMVFTLSLNSAQQTPVSVQASTANLTALVGRDYRAKTELLTFAPGEKTKTFTVDILGTSQSTSDVVFMVKLTSSTATVGRPTAYGIMKYGA